MTSGPNKGERFAGAILLDVPFDYDMVSIPDNISFSEHPHVFGNLGDVEHFKVTGTVYSPSNNGRIYSSEDVSVFGPVYNQEGIPYSNILSRCTDGVQYHVSKSGRFNNNDRGEWYFGIGARREGNYVGLAVGHPDLANGPFNPGHTYSLTLKEFKIEGGTIFTRSTGDQWPTKLRTSEYTPFEALDNYMETLQSLLSKAEWYALPQRQIVSAKPRLAGYVEGVLQRLNPNAVFPDRGTDWGILAAEAYNSVQFFNSNGIAYAKDFVNLRKDAAKTLNLLKSFGKTGRLASKAANLFLTFYYGWRLTIKDTQELVDAYQTSSKLRSNRCKATSQRSWESHGATYLATFQCYFIRNAFMSGMDRFIYDYDLALTPDNLWDLVPFSFVVDWFTNIGGVLETASDYYNLVQAHEVICTGRSIKAVRHTSGRQLSSQLAGELTFSYYSRSYTEGPYVPTFQFCNSVNPLDHAIEGTALIVSRR